MNGSLTWIPQNLSPIQCTRQRALSSHPESLPKSMAKGPWHHLLQLSPGAALSGHQTSNHRTLAPPTDSRDRGSCLGEMELAKAAYGEGCGRLQRKDE